MLRDNSEPNWTVRIFALCPLALAAVGGLLLFNTANANTEAPTVVATSCGEFKADARKLFEDNANGTLSGTFAPGDHVRVTIDFDGIAVWWDRHFVGWESAGVLANAKRAKVKTSYASKLSLSDDEEDFIGAARLQVDIDVNTAGDGAFTLRKSSKVPLFTELKIIGASCASAKNAPTS
jgi:hypothetical protein